MAPTTALALAVALLGATSGCEKRVVATEDCTRVGNKLEQAFKRDAVAAQQLAEAKGNQIGGYIDDEAARIKQAWGEECAQLVGRPVAQEDLTCLDRADTIDDVYSCAGGR